MGICMVSVDVEEDLNQRTFRGAQDLDKILEVFDRFAFKATLFTTGEILRNYPDKVKRWSKRHEIACHGYYHVPLFELPVPERRKQLDDYCKLYENLFGEKPKGFRAVQNSIDRVQLRLLEEAGFTYDSSVIPRIFALRKNAAYKGEAPVVPYHPDYDNYLVAGDMKILEIPLSRLIFAIPLQGTWIRMFGVELYRFLLTLNKPKFFSLTMHSWDCIHYEGRFSRNSGVRYLSQLDKFLGILSKDCKLLSGSEIASNMTGEG